MKSLFLKLILILTMCSFKSEPAPDLQTFFKLSNYYFKKYVSDGLVNYKYASIKREEIGVFRKMISEMDLSKSSPIVKKAFYINAYNLLVIDQVVKQYPVNGPMDYNGFFDLYKHTVCGESLTLDQLEKRMFDEFNDTRFHFVLACAAKSCPKLADFSYSSDNVEKKLDERTKLTINQEDFIIVDHNRKVVEVSKIFEWYKDDFITASKSLIDFINLYKTDKVPRGYKVIYIPYNWNLNERI